MNNRFIIAVIVVLAFAACRWESEKSPVKTQSEQRSEDEMLLIIDEDKAFSKACTEKGMKKAFLEYLADDAVMLRPDQMPIVEGDVVKFLSSQEDTSFIMSWVPKGGHIARSNDLGFTYGIYKVQTKDTVFSGTYVSIWQKQNDGKWKVILDSENPGTGAGAGDTEEAELPVKNGE